MHLCSARRHASVTADVLWLTSSSIVCLVPSAVNTLLTVGVAGWSGLLGKRNLQAAGRRVRDMCPQCNLASESPGVRSACVVSMEMNPSFQVMADVLKQEEKQASYLPLQTPRDASVTHILVFPTSATAQVRTPGRLPFVLTVALLLSALSCGSSYVFFVSSCFCRSVSL